MKHNYSRKFSAALITVLLFNTLVVFAQNRSSMRAAQASRFTVVPNATSEITMETIPNATCVLHVAGSYDVAHQLKIFSDEQGMIHLHVLPPEESDEAAHFEINCAADGKFGKFPLDLRASFAPSFDMPAPAIEVVKAPLGTYVRPALTKDVALQLADQEVTKRGYPPRPDPEHAPDAFATWLKAVTKPSTFIPPHLIERHDIQHGPRQTSAGFEGSYNWSGYELRGPANSYDAVEGVWYVPKVSNESGHVVYSAFWIGLDGDSSGNACVCADLVQDGTEQNFTDIKVWQGTLWGYKHYYFSTYYAWTEFLPQQTKEQVVSNFSVNPGDEIYSELWMATPCSSGGVPIPCWGSPMEGGTYAYFEIENLTTSQHTVIPTARGTTYVGGYEAEWIMERPTVNGSYPDLANYGTTFMYDAFALTATPAFTTGQWVSYNSANNQLIYMYGADPVQPISYVQPISDYYMEFFWQGYH